MDTSGTMGSKSRSLPSLRSKKGHGASPYDAHMTLCAVEVAKKSFVREAVGFRSIRVVSKGRLPNVAMERGLEWERPQAKAKVPPKALPPVSEILRLAMSELSFDNLNFEDGPRQVAFGGSGQFRGGPRLPLKCSRRDMDALYERPRDELFQFFSKKRTRNGSPPKPVPEVQPERGEETKATETSASRRPSIEKSGISALQPGEVEDDNTLPFPWSEDEMRQCFARFDSDQDGEVHTDELQTMTKYLGGNINPGEAAEIAREFTSYATVNWDEFKEFLMRLRTRDVQRLRQQFDEADFDKSGALDYHEVNHALFKLGYIPTKQTTLEAIEAMIGNPDVAAKDVVVSFREFEHLREYLRKTECFCQAEVQELRGLFDRANAGSSGTKRRSDGLNEEKQASAVVLAEDIWRITMYLGYSASAEHIMELVAMVDADGSRRLIFEELLKVVRLLHEDERNILIRVLKKRGFDTSSGIVPIKKLGIVLGDLGYFISEDTVFEVIESLGELEDDENNEFLTLEEVCCFLRFYRQTEGFAQTELDELTQLFESQCREFSTASSAALPTKSASASSSDVPLSKRFSVVAPQAAKKLLPSLDALQLNKVLRWSGYALTLPQVQQYITELDLDSTQRLQVHEFIKLMRRLNQKDAMHRRAVFDSFDVGRNDCMHASSLDKALAIIVGVEPPIEQIMEAAKKAGIQFADETSMASGFGVPVSTVQFETFYRHFRAVQVQEVRERANYSAQEVEQLRSIFQENDSDGGGSLEKQELAKIIAQYFPDATKSKEGQQQIQQALADVTKDGSGALDFHAFLHLMRKCDDHRDQEDVRREAAAIRECNLSSEEVEGYRQIFTRAADWTGELTVPVLAAILSPVLEMTELEMEALTKIVRETHPFGSEAVRFPQFLQIVKRITTDNHGDINRAASRIVHAEQKKRQGR